MWWRFLMIICAYMLIGAHFLRFGQNEFAIGFAIAPILLFIKANWAIRILQLGLIVSAILVWGISAFDYIQTRIAMDTPWLRLSLIMSGVILFTFLAAACGNGIIKKRRNRSPFA